MQSLATSLTQLELGWLVGLLEGEGYFCCQDRSDKKDGYDLLVRVTMTDKDVIERLADTIGGCRILGPYKNSGLGTKLLYRVSLHGESAAGLMQLVRPFMGNRRKEQIDVALTKWRHSKHYRKRSFDKVEEIKLDVDSSMYDIDAAETDDKVTH